MKLRQKVLTILKLFGRFFFTLVAIAALIPVAFYRLFLILKGSSQTTYHPNPFITTHQDVFKSNRQIVRRQGYQISSYEFKTQDNAYVSFWRVQKKEENLNNSQQSIPRQVVIVQHGLLDCSITWFLHQEKQDCLPFLLASQNYDVWVGNNRGTKYSDRNAHLPGYWDFNFDHLVAYDLPVLIEGVLRQTQAQKLTYIGHSQGSTQFLTALGVHPRLKDKIKTFIGLGPIICINHVTDHIFIKIASKLKLCQLLKLIGFKALFKVPSWMSKITGMLICNIPLCAKLVHKIVTHLCGESQKTNFDLERLGVVMAHEPGGGSLCNVIQWLQFHKSKKTRKFDYGVTKNLQKYGSPEPPEYSYTHLNKLPFHTHLFKGTKDSVISEKDFQFLLQNLRPSRTSVYVLEDYAHLDYLWGVNACQDIYEKIILIIQAKAEQSGRGRSSTNDSSEILCHKQI